VGRALSSSAVVIHCGLDVQDLGRAAAFYELLGLKQLRSASIAGDSEHLFLGNDGVEMVQLTVRHNEPLADDPRRPGHVAVRVSSIEEVLRRLRAAGREAERDPFRARADGPLLSFVRDPDGYRVELVEA
jgi:lactoylglutathione lyase